MKMFMTEETRVRRKTTAVVCCHVLSPFPTSAILIYDRTAIEAI